MSNDAAFAQELLQQSIAAAIQRMLPEDDSTSGYLQASIYPTLVPAMEELLREAMDWEFRIRLAEIRRQVRIRQVLGDERYTRIRELVRRRQEQQRLLQQQNRTDRPLQQRQSDRQGQG